MDIFKNRIIKLGFLSLLLTIFVAVVFKPTPPDLTLKKVQGIALLNSVLNDVQRKAGNGLIWEPIEVGEKLFSNDLIRTGSDSTAKIVFDKSKAQISLEEKSMFVIKEGGDKLSLNVIEGDILINNTEDSKLQVTSGDNKIALEKGKISLKVDKQGNLNLEVLDGSVLAQISGKKQTVNKNEKSILRDGVLTKEKISLVVKTPLNNQTVYLNKEQEAFFKWHSDYDDQIYDLYVGYNKKDLKKIQTIKIKNEAWIKVEPGIIYWQLTGKNSNHFIESKIYKANILPYVEPTQIFPRNKEVGYLKEGKLALRWRYLDGATYNVMVFADNKMSELKFMKKDLSSNNLSTSDLEVNKTYFWKVQALREGEIIESKVTSFRTQVYTEIRPPKLEFPIDTFSIVTNELKNEQFFSWESLTSATEYEFEIRDGSGKKISHKTKEPQIKLTELAPGDYKWRVRGIFKNKTSEFTTSYSLLIKKLPTIGWRVKKLPEFYVDRKEYQVDWEPVRNLKHFIFTVTSHSDPSFNVRKTIFKNTASFMPRMPGIYKINIESYNLDGYLSAQSKDLFFNLKEIPLLEAPKFAIKEIKGDGKGDVNINFDPVKAAKYYMVEVKDLSGSTVQISRVDTLPGMIRNLNPGEYNLFVKAVDELERQGKVSESIKVSIPAIADLPKMKLKRIKIR
ncbi:MAG: hypothetical protein CME66_03550 [Halobacteriovoraceae bacterium]|nr:hypothetical protein [Halobacteriovoraceae bacterium]